MKKLIMTSALSLCATMAVAAINPSDVAIVRVNASGVPNDNFSFVALRALSAADVMFFTDNGWTITNGFRTGEGAGTTDIVTNGLPAGAVVDVFGSGFGNTGEQLFLFTNTVVAPGLLYGVDWGNAAGWDADGTNASASADPRAVAPFLATNLAISLGSSPSYAYTGTVTGAATDLLNSIANPANWAVVAAATNNAWSRGSFTVSGGPATPPVLNAIGNKSVTVGNLLQFSVTAQPTESDPVTLTVSNAPVGSVFSSTNENGSFAWTPSSTGTFVVTFNAADDDGASAETITILVAAVVQALGPGDVAIVRVNASGVPNDNFSFVALRDLTAGDALFFTDNGWTITNGFRTGEGAGTTDIITNSLPAGTVVDVFTASLGASGEQLFLFTNTVAVPGLLYGIDWGNAAGWDADGTNASASADPRAVAPFLATNLALSLGSNPSYEYTGPLTGSVSILLNNIANPANWAVTTSNAWSRGNFVVTNLPDLSPLPRLNELVVNPPGSPDDNREYVELIGSNGASLNGLSLVEVDGNSTNCGVVISARSLNGKSFGTNGMLILGDLYTALPPYTIPGATTKVDLNHTPTAFIDNNSVTFFLVSNFTGLVGDDLDTGNSGTLTTTPWAGVLDSVGWSDGGASDHVYSPASLTQFSGTPDAATRIPTNFAAESFNAWYNGDLMTNAGDTLGITYDPTKASANLPSGAILTPGATNYWSATPSRTPPVLDAIGNHSVTVNTPLQFNVVAQPTDGDTVTLTISNAPVGSVFGSTNENGSFTWTPSATGTYVMAFYATDVDGTTFESVSVFVVAQATTGSILLNEILVNPPGTDDNREYVELRGPPGASLNGLTMVEVEGDTGQSGNIDNARDLTGLSFGANGLLLLGDNYATSTPYTNIPAQTTLANLNRTPATMENDNTTFLIVTNFSGSVGSDSDTNDDGVFDSPPWGAILDSVGWRNPAVAGVVYGAASLTQSSGTPDGATRFPASNHIATATDWYNGDTVTDPGLIPYDAGKASANLPTGAYLTPGAPNYPFDDGDNDDDSLPDAWETEHFGNTTNTATGDADGDGFDNLAEYITGTDPTNSGSFFEVEDTSNAVGQVVTFLATSGRVYDVQCTPDPTLPTFWSNLITFIATSNGVANVTDTNAVDVRLYRVTGRLP